MDDWELDDDGWDEADDWDKVNAECLKAIADLNKHNDDLDKA